MGNIQIKSVPEDVHQELRRRARQAGMTLRDYVLGLITKDQLLPSKQDWFKELDDLGPIEFEGSSAELINEIRDERTEELMSRLSIDSAPDADRH